MEDAPELLTDIELDDLNHQFLVELQKDPDGLQSIETPGVLLDLGRVAFKRNDTETAQEIAQLLFEKAYCGQDDPLGHAKAFTQLEAVIY